MAALLYLIRSLCSYDRVNNYYLVNILSVPDYGGKRETKLSRI